MVTMHRSRNWKIEIFGREHGVPHIHVSGPDFRATVSVETSEMIAGALPAATLKEVRRWLSDNRDAAMSTWNERNPNR